MYRDRAEVRDVAQGLAVVHDEVSILAFAVSGADGLGPHPVGDENRSVFLIEGLAVDAVRVAGEEDRTVGEVRQDERNDGVVVSDQVAFGISVGGPEYLFQVGELDGRSRLCWRHTATSGGC